MAFSTAGKEVIEPNPITYRMLHEDAAGCGLEDSFFKLSGINPDAVVKCNCAWNQGHRSDCDIVAAHDLRLRQSSGRPRT